jgi:hypothetical protein
MYLRKHCSNTPHPRIEPKVLGRTELSNQSNAVNINGISTSHNRMRAHLRCEVDSKLMREVLCSYASMYCITVLSLSFLLMCIAMFITTHVTLQLKLPAMGIVLRILYTLMFAAIAERPGVQGWALKATSSRGTHQLMVNHLYFICNLMLHNADTLNQAVSGTRHPNIIWRV